MTYRTANEDTIPHLKSHDCFGQYGKILKLFLAKRTNMPDNMNAQVLQDPKNQPVNVYINYTTPKEASACILASDGALMEGQRLRAGWGTTKYCPAFLRGGKCNQDNCMMAHEHGDEVDPVGGAPGPVTREEMSTLKHAMKEQESRDSRGGRGGSNAGLPASASWAKMPAASAMPNPIAPKSNATRLPKATVHPLPARPPSREAHVAAASARTRQGSAQSMVGSGTRRSSTSSSAEDKMLLRRSSLLDAATTEVVAEPPPMPSPGPPPGFAPVASTSTARQTIVEPHSEAVDFPPEPDFEATLQGFGEGSFSFNLNLDHLPAGGNSGTSKDKKPDLSWIDTSGDGSLFGTDYLVSSSSASGGAAPSGVPAMLDRSQSQDGYSGAFDPFAETPGEDEPSTRPKSSRFDFAKKGLFGSTDSLASLGMASAVEPVRTHLPNGRASPLSILTASTAIRAHSPKRNVISPPPGLKSVSPANEALWHTGGGGSKMDSPLLRSGSPGDPLSSLLRMPMSTQPLGMGSFASHIPPSMGDLARQPLPSALSTAAASLPPPKSSGPPGLNRSNGMEDPYAHMLGGASALLPPRGGGTPSLASSSSALTSHPTEHILSDPAILNMSAQPQPPRFASPGAFQQLDGNYGGYYGQAHGSGQSFVPFANR
jgi:hypothetical protein